MSFVANENDIITTALTAGGQGATASTVYGDYSAYKAFNRYADSDDQWSANGSGDQWLKIDLTLTPQGIHSASLTSYNVYARSNGYESYNMNTWVLAGSNNDIDYTTIDTQTDLSWSNGEEKMFTLGSPTSPYRYFRITGSSPSGNPDIGELQLIGALCQMPSCYFLSRRDRMDMRAVSNRNQLA